MSRAVGYVPLVTALLGGCAGEIDELRVAPPSEWQVTRGALDAGSGLERADGVSAAKFRAVVPASDGNAAELRFVDEGVSPATARLASGAMRRQIGLKLRAQDGCNLVYVMWRLEPAAELVVSVKRNPGQRTHAECGARGYRNLSAPGSVPLEASQPGRTHVLRAIIRGRALRVWADGALAWQGDLDDDALALDGPAGVRSDNERFEVELRVRPAMAHRAPPPPDSDED